MKLQLQYPVKKVSINQGFGNIDAKYTSLGMSAHNGIDYYALDGTPILASHDGTVTYAGLDGSNGLLVVIMTDEQFEYKDGQAYFKTLYGHLKTGTLKVTAGDKVKVGQVIALADNTGFSSGSHLHFGLKPVLQGEQDWQWFNLEQANGLNGAIDPTPYLPSHREFLLPMTIGSTGEDVEKLQAFLIRSDYMAPVAKLGYYGKLTAVAIKKFMVDTETLSPWESLFWHGTTVGPKTLKALNQLYK